MSLLFTAHSINNLSELTIDADKDWNGKELFNITSILVAMQQGDIIYHNGITLARLPAGTANHNLQCQGPGQNPKWS